MSPSSVAESQSLRGWPIGVWLSATPVRAASWWYAAQLSATVGVTAVVVGVAPAAAVVVVLVVLSDDDEQAASAMATSRAAARAGLIGCRVWERESPRGGALRGRS